MKYDEGCVFELIDSFDGESTPVIKDAMQAWYDYDDYPVHLDKFDENQLFEMAFNDGGGWEIERDGEDVYISKTDEYAVIEAEVAPSRKHTITRPMRAFKVR